MINLQTKINIIDNSSGGSIEGRCIKLYKGSKNTRPAKVGDLIMISVTKTYKGPQRATGGGAKIKPKRGDLFKAIIVRTKKDERGLKWAENAAALVSSAAKGGKKKDTYTPLGTRIKGPISGNLRSRSCDQAGNKYEKILALAKVITPIYNNI